LRNCEAEKADSRNFVGGDPNDTKDILIDDDDTLFPVTTNLEAAFRRLRSKGCRYRRLWVDVVCVNQKDATERSQQLLFMGSIYRRAQEVAAWTGKEEEENHHSNAVWDILDSSGDSADSTPSLSEPQIASLV
jgi:hypothetical protein